MTQRFLGYQPVGSVAVGPQDREVLVGSFAMQDGDDSIWVRIKQNDPPDIWAFSYGLLTWRSAQGQELGTIKVYGDVDGEVYRLGVGLPPIAKEGNLYFTARAYNRRWIEQREPPIWSLDFEAQSGVSNGGGSSGGFGIPATLVSFADLADARVAFNISTIGEDKFARVLLSPS